MSFVPAIAVISKQKHLVAAFRNAGAIAPEHARTPRELGLSEGLAWRRLHLNAVLRETSTGAWYLDQASWDALRVRRRRIASLVVGAALLVLALLLYYVRRPG
jgi:hypothetical protein